MTGKDYARQWVERQPGRGNNRVVFPMVLVEGAEEVVPELAELAPNLNKRVLEFKNGTYIQLTFN